MSNACTTLYQSLLLGQVWLTSLMPDDSPGAPLHDGENLQDISRTSCQDLRDASLPKSDINLFVDGNSLATDGVMI